MKVEESFVNFMNTRHTFNHNLGRKNSQQLQFNRQIVQIKTFIPAAQELTVEVEPLGQLTY